MMFDAETGSQRQQITRTDNAVGTQNPDAVIRNVHGTAFASAQTILPAV